MFSQLLVSVIARHDNLSDDDSAMPGVYSIEVQQTLPREQQHGVALDLFHEGFGIDDLDSFDISVHDELGATVDEAENYVSGSGLLIGGGVWKVSDGTIEDYLSALSDRSPSP